MKKQKQPKRASFVRRFPRLMATGILMTIAFLTIGVVAGISKQRSRVKASIYQQGAIHLASPATANPATGSQVNQTAQIKPLTAEEAQRLAIALKALANQSSDGLHQAQHQDGTVSMDAQGHFQNVALAKRNDDGSVSQSCVDNPVSGAVFFGIDPKLVGLKTKTAGTASGSSTANQ